MTKKFSELAHFWPFGSNPLLQWPILTTQTHTIRRGALRFATQISPQLNLIIEAWLHK